MLQKIISKIRSLFTTERGPVSFVYFRDYQKNFEIFYPNSWKFDQDIAVVDGKYTISFESPDGIGRFVVYVDNILPSRFSFRSYAKTELESPSSGVYTAIRKEHFKGMEAYTRDYTYETSGMHYFGGGVMFFTGSSVFSISWSAPARYRVFFEGIFRHMLKSLVVRKDNNS